VKKHRQRKRFFFTTLGLLMLLPVCTSEAGELLNAHVERRDDHYLLHLDMRIKASYADAYRALVDFKHIPLINDSIKSAQILAHKGKITRVRLVAEGCVWIFCRRIAQVQTVTARDDGYIISITDPAHSDLRYGRSLWHLVAEGKTTRITYNADFVPDFWVPPLIGPMIFKHRLLEEGQKTINGIEHLIQQHQP
jgi:hypothetical protein